MAKHTRQRIDEDYDNFDMLAKPDFDTRDREGYDDFEPSLEQEMAVPELPERDMDGSYFHEIVDEEEFEVLCLECGFNGMTDDANGECPNCGGSDTELA